MVSEGSSSDGQVILKVLLVGHDGGGKIMCSQHFDFGAELRCRTLAGS